MIKGITFVHAASTSAVYDTLHRFFSAIGLEPGRNWEMETSRGAPFLAPLGSFELLDGMAHLPAEVLIEVTAIDDGLVTVKVVGRNSLGDHVIATVTLRMGGA